MQSRGNLYAHAEVIDNINVIYGVNYFHDTQIYIFVIIGDLVYTKVSTASFGENWNMMTYKSSGTSASTVIVDVSGTSYVLTLRSDSAAELIAMLTKYNLIKQIKCPCCDTVIYIS